MSKTLSLETIKDIDGGKVVDAINHLIRSGARDCAERSADPSPRVLELKLIFRPELDPDTLKLKDVSMQPTMNLKLPPRKGRKYPMVPMGREGELLFEPQSPENPRQMPLYPDTPPAPEAQDEAEDEPLRHPAAVKGS